MAVISLSCYVANAAANAVHGCHMYTCLHVHTHMYVYVYTYMYMYVSRYLYMAVNILCCLLPSVPITGNNAATSVYGCHYTWLLDSQCANGLWFG